MDAEVVRRGAALVFRRRSRDPEPPRFEEGAGRPSGVSGRRRRRSAHRFGNGGRRTGDRRRAQRRLLPERSRGGGGGGAAGPRLAVIGAGAGVTCAGWTAAGAPDVGLEQRAFGFADAVAAGAQLRRGGDPRAGLDAGAPSMPGPPTTAEAGRATPWVPPWSALSPPARAEGLWVPHRKEDALIVPARNGELPRRWAGAPALWLPRPSAGLRPPGGSDPSHRPARGSVRG